MTVVCSICGGQKVQKHAWVNANNLGEYKGEVGDDPETWCEDCEEHSNLIPIHEWDKKKRNG